MKWSGGCLCGSIKYQASDKPQWATYCHCATCRKVSGAPYIGFVEFPHGSFEWLQGQCSQYRSSNGATRGFCSHCGSSLTFEVDGMLFISLGSLDFPEQVVVESHCYTKSRLPRIELSDGLPQFPGSVGGKGGLDIN